MKRALRWAAENWGEAIFLTWCAFVVTCAIRGCSHYQ